MESEYHGFIVLVTVRSHAAFVGPSSCYAFCVCHLLFIVLSFVIVLFDVHVVWSPCMVYRDCALTASCVVCVQDNPALGSSRVSCRSLALPSWGPLWQQHGVCPVAAEGRS